MLKIKTNKGYLDLGGDFTVQIDEKSPVMTTGDHKPYRSRFPSLPTMQG